MTFLLAIFGLAVFILIGKYEKKNWEFAWNQINEKVIFISYLKFELAKNGNGVGVGGISPSKWSKNLNMSIYYKLPMVLFELSQWKFEEEKLRL